MNRIAFPGLACLGVGAVLAGAVLPVRATESNQPSGTRIGEEKAILRHLQNGEELKLPLAELIDRGRALFEANWTDQDGAGRRLMKGTGERLSDTTQTLTGTRAFNRISGPDANSCRGCHFGPDQRTGGGGDFVANAFVMAERFDYVTFERTDAKATRGAVDERGQPVTLQNVGNSRLPPGLWGAGYLEMIARQMTADLRRTRDAIQPGQSKPLVSKGVAFGELARRRDGSWDTKDVSGLPRQSLATSSASRPPSLTILPWRQSGSVVSIRELTSSSLNQHLGIQTTERFGVGTDPDGDSVVNEMTRGDVTAIAVFQATLPVPGRVIPNDRTKERMIVEGERLFGEIGCASCHVPALPLEQPGWTYAEPGPDNQRGNLRSGEAPVLNVDLTSEILPRPRLSPSADDARVIRVPAYTDFKLHDITDSADADAAEPLDINETPGSPPFFAGNRRFLTRRLWDVGRQPAHFHHGLFLSLKQAVLAHAGEAIESRRAYQGLEMPQQAAVLEFLGTLQVLPAGSASLVVDEQGRAKAWPPPR